METADLVLRSAAVGVLVPLGASVLRQWRARPIGWLGAALALGAICQLLCPSALSAWGFNPAALPLLAGEYRSEVAIALQSTGVVTGEYGVVEAYERKKQEIKDWLSDPHETVQEFARWDTTGLEQMIVAERKRVEEAVALRRHRWRVSQGSTCRLLRSMIRPI